MAKNRKRLKRLVNHRARRVDHGVLLVGAWYPACGKRAPGAIDRAPADGRQLVYLSLRRTDEAEYLAKLSLGEGGAVFLQASRLIRAGAEEEITLAPEVRLPTTLRIRAWPEGSAQPDWQVVAGDSHSALQGPGTVGIGARLGQGVTEFPVVVRVDDLRVGQ